MMYLPKPVMLLMGNASLLELKAFAVDTADLPLLGESAVFHDVSAKASHASHGECFLSTGYIPFF